MKIDIDPTETPNIWHLTDQVPVMEIYANEQFDNSQGHTILPGSVARGDIYRRVVGSVAGNVLTWPVIASIDTTEDALNNQLATYSAYIRAANQEPFPWLLDFPLAPIVTPGVISRSWPEIRIHAARGVIARHSDDIENLITLLIQSMAQGIYSEVPAGAIDGVNETFTLSRTPLADSQQVFLNGNLQKEGNPGAGTDSYSITGAVITHHLPPQPGDWLFVVYRTASGILGNAPSTVEGIGTLLAAQTATIFNPAVLIDSAIECIPKDNGIVGNLRVLNRVAGANPSFDVESDQGTDAGLFKWILHR